MAIKKTQIYSTIWSGCDKLRGSMDASQYKDYVLIILFVKYLSDKAKLNQTPLHVPEGCFFEDFVALRNNPHIGENIDIKLQTIAEENNAFIGDLNFPSFDDDSKLGEGKTKIETLSKLIGVFDKEELDFSHNRAADDDLLGDAYEFLMRKFAVQSGKSKGQFYTPAEVSRVMSKILHLEDLSRAGNTIYDMACGSGSLLLRALNETANRKPTLYGQEKDSTTASLAKLNMLLHGIVGAKIKVGDTLNDPKFTIGNMLDTFDVCVANPPFSLKNWMASNGETDPYHRWNPNLLPPAQYGDLAFLQHMIASMKPEMGRGACIMPLGVLFRGNNLKGEYGIRRHIVERHYISGIIGLPPKLFYGTPTPPCIVVLDMRNRENRNGIFFINAKDGYKKDGANNRLREQDIKRIVDAWDAQETIPHYARMVTWDEIEKNDFNLNIPRYVQPRETEIQQDIDAHLHGGLPRHDIENLEDYWEACPSLKYALFAKLPNGRYSLAINKEDIRQTIVQNGDFIHQHDLFSNELEGWRKYIAPKMMTISKGCRPKAYIEDWSGSLFETVKKSKSIVDPYAVYDRIMNYWNETMQDDCYIIGNDGWTLPDEKTLNPKKKTGYADINCDLLPVDVLLKEFFQAETREITNVEERIEAYNDEIDTLLEDEADTFDSFDKVNESVVKKALPYASQSGLDEKVLRRYLDLYDKKKTASSRLSSLQTELTDKILRKYAEIRNDETVLKDLVVNKKWLSTIISSCQEEMHEVETWLIAEIGEIVSRYENPLPEIEKKVTDLESKVSAHLKEMGFEL